MSDGNIARGTTGQVLKKVSNDDFDYSWEDESGGPGGAAWGAVTGTLSDQTDLQTALDGKSAISHNHDAAYSDIGHTHAQLHNRQHSIIDASDHTFPGGTTFLRADGTFANPPGGSEAFPIGSVFIAVVDTNPGTLLGYGTWSAFAAGRVLVGLDAGQTEFDAVEETGGAKTHTLLTTEIPAHNHQTLRERSATTGGATTLIARTSDTSSTVDTAVFTENTGGGGAHNNLQPYIVVYMWKRTA